MRRAERLLQLIQALRRHRRPVTALSLAAELEVSVRTVYRDVAGLQGQGIPVRGEAGVGYVLDKGFDLPPLMFNANEIEAVILGLRFVERRGDRVLVDAARDVKAKIGAVIPDHLRPLLFDAGLIVPPHCSAAGEAIDVGALREAIRHARKLAIVYRDEAGEKTRRTVWPIALTYFDAARLLVAWCELRAAFRHFRADRILAMERLAGRIPARRSVLLRQWQDEIRRDHARPDLDLLA